MRRCRARSRGCYGGKVLANYAKAQGWNVVADLNNDIIGNSCVVRRRVRRHACPRAVGRAALAGRRRSWRRRRTASAARMTRRRATSRASSTASPTGSRSGSTCGRSGAPTASAAAATISRSSSSAIPAARISVAVENYNWQHQDLRTENGIRYGDTDRPCGFRLSRQDDQAERRRARRHRQRPAAARAEGRGRGEHGYDGDVGAGAGRVRLSCPLAPDRREPIGSKRRCRAS